MWIFVHFTLTHKSFELPSLFFFPFCFVFVILIRRILLPVFFTDPFFAYFNLLLNSCIVFYNSVMLVFDSDFCLVLSFIFYFFVEILTLFVHCSLDLSEYFYDCCFELFYQVNSFSPSLNFFLWDFILFFCLEHILLFLHFVSIH